MSLAAETRRAVDDHPFLVDALRAEVCNYTAAARYLDVDGDADAVATALRRYAEDLPRLKRSSQEVRVTMRSGVGTDADPTDALLVVGDVTIGTGDGDRTAILATGDVNVAGFGLTVRRLAVAEVTVEAAGFAPGAAAFVVGKRDGANALRIVEQSFDVVIE